MEKSKQIKIESHGISPWHHFLENMSWGSSRAQNDEDKMAFLNVDSSLKDGGRGLEDILMADFLQSLSFSGDKFVNEFLKSADMSLQPQSCEIKGNAGNYYIPYEDDKSGIRLAQPDGWIADENTLILLEAKGYRKSASLNKGQLAKEYLIAQNVANHTGRGNNFYILLLINKKENIYKDGDGKNNYQLTDDDFEDLWKANVHDLKNSFGKVLEEQLKKEEYISSDDVWGDLEHSWAEIRKHFLWITWKEIAALAEKNKNQITEQIIKTVKFHSSENKTENTEDWPIFSQFLAELAGNKVPLYLFYNGGCGNKLLKDWEEKYWTAIGHTGDTPWKAWHDLKNIHHAALMDELAKYEEARREALSALRVAEKEIENFYKERLGITPSPKTTRKAFEMLGESSQLENTANSCFTQRMKVEKERFQGK